MEEDPSLLAVKDEKANQVKDDSSQYKRFSIHLEEPTQPEMSFPISEDSKESRAFKEHLPNILSHLRNKKIKWQSIECVGRLHDSGGGDMEIRSTVVIGVSKLTEDTQTLQQDLQSAITTLTLPVEVVEGGFVRLSYFGFRQLQRPLVCGASCGTVERGATGTIGGFVTIKGDPDPDAIYAVTNHHVLSKEREPIPWVNEVNLAAHLGISVVAQDDLKALCGESVMDLGRNEINQILDLLTMFPSPRSYIQELVSQYLQRRPRHQEGNVDRNRTESFLTNRITYLEYLKHLTPYIRRQLCELHELLECLELNERHQFYEFLRRLKYIKPSERVYYVEFFRRLNFDQRLEYLEHLYPLKRFRDLNFAERLNQNERLDRAEYHRFEMALNSLEYIEPNALLNSSDDLEFGERLELLSLLNFSESDHLTVDDPAREYHVTDIEIIKRDRNDAKTHHKNTNADRLIGIVWASSGKRRQVEPKYPKADQIYNNVEDWALIKLFPDKTDEGITRWPNNSFSSNILRPRQPEQPFIRVKPWMGLSTFRVSKRGRTTDYTIGEVNGSIGAGASDRDGSHEFGYSIVSTSTNGLFALAGDSGSWIMDKGGQLVGMVWGQNTATKSALFTPAQYLFTWIQKAFEGAMERQSISLQDTFEKGGRSPKTRQQEKRHQDDKGEQCLNRPLVDHQASLASYIWKEYDHAGKCIDKAYNLELLPKNPRPIAPFIGA
ncbi:hypothetical protein FOXYS1_12312 [Fusarium oxysporum]|uniref:Serine protease n=1 Tax=Fusarium oxysporum TaxID=5507 RepID=A0A8H5A410_FUSOX|nr:hypothetical protein FOXYS1_12312 [Fusarium oxysporum]